MKITEMARILGVSTKVIRNYEEKGVLSPLRDELNYRNYSVSDFFHAIHAMRFNRLGVPIGELEESFKMPDKFIQNIDKAYLKNKEKIKYDLLNFFFLENYKKEIATVINNVGCYWFEMAEEEIYLPYSNLNNWEDGMTVENEDEFTEWLKYVQYARLEVLIKKKDEGFHCLTIPKECTKYFESDLKNYEKTIKSQTYFVTVIKATNEEDIQKQFETILTMLREKGKEYNCEEYYRAKLYLLDEGQCYFKVMVPVK